MRTALPSLLLLAGCTDGGLPPVGDAPYVPPPERCEPADLTEPARLSPCNTGSGIFGEWQLDDRGLPCYHYGIDQHRDARAAYPVTEADAGGAPLDRRDHWAFFGNRRVNALVFNDGYVEVVTQDRGVSYLDKRDDASQAFAGGYSYLDDGEATWSSAYAARPPGAATVRRFGMGYAELATSYRDISVTRVMGAPPGDVPAIVSEVTIENRGAEPRELRHYEVWDVGRRPIEINWLVSGDALPGAPATARKLRDERNAMFVEEVAYRPAERLLSVRRDYVGDEPRPPKGEPSAVDYYPVDPFLAALDAPVDDVWVDQARFFGEGGARRPDAVRKRAAGEGVAGGTLSSRSAAGQPHALVIESRLELGPGEARTLRFAFGYARSGEPYEPVVAAARVDDVRGAYAAHLAPRLFWFASERDAALGRELAWHSYAIEASVGYRDYWQTHVVPQGSAYLYLHGADGAARDLGLFALPLVYTDPALAREELLLYMGIQLADDSFSYAFQGHGMIDNAGIHTAPSDLPLFFLWALGEYLGATGDLGLLDETIPFYPREARPAATGWDHLAGAVRHHLDVVGTGEHGLVRVQTGDWSDGIVVAAPDRELAIAKGESVPNTQMAVAVLPRVAELIEGRDAALAARIGTAVDGYREALKTQWTGQHFVRAYYGDGVPVDADTINLEAQVWALIGDTFADPADRATLLDAIDAELSSPIGATLKPGGEVWPAISALLTWGYAKSDPERAWRHLSDNTMVAHARAFPAVWYGIWSGPDGLRSSDGWTWKSQATPMLDFPVQNNNQHAMPILAALRVAGVEATAAGLRIAPPSGEPLSLRCALVDLSLTAEVMQGSYRPEGTADRILEIWPPPGTAIAAATRDGAPVEPQAPLHLDVPGGTAVSFRLELSSSSAEF